MNARSTRRILCLVSLAAAGCASEAATGPAPGRTLAVDVGGATVDVTLGPGRLAVDEARVVSWIQVSAQAVGGYLGRFPVAHAELSIEPVEGRGIKNGVARGAGGTPSIHVELGESTTAEDLDRDWVLTHEMLHLGFPDVERRWLEEGLAVYVEPLARARIGRVREADVWREMLETYAQGLPEPGDRGLDHTDTWGRSYYGGAIFCLVADIEIHAKTKNARGLEHALRAIVAEGGVISVRWDARRALEVGDRGTGVAVLVPLYERLKDRPGDLDLDAIWRALGVSLRGREVAFQDDAPQASIRKALTRPTHP